MCRLVDFDVLYFENDHVYDDHGPQHLAVVVLSDRPWNKIHFSVATMFGNFIVLNAFVKNEKLRTINNLFIMNLSAADFCIGLGTVFRVWSHIKILMKKP